MTTVWNEKLITRSRAADLCGTWPVTMDNADYDVTYLRCAQCDANITRLPGQGMTTMIDELIAAVLRHMCSSHGYNLSGAGNEDKGINSPAAGDDGRHYSDRRPGRTDR